MKPVFSNASVLACLAAVAVSACVRTSDGVPIPSDVAGGTAPTGAAPSSLPSVTTRPAEEADLTEPGVVATTRAPIPANSVTCSRPVSAPVRLRAQVNDPEAPKITVGVPDGWSMSDGSGDIGGRMTGPDGMFATVSIEPTQLDPAAAFRAYSDEVMEQSPVSSVSVLPGELCEYSGQKLRGAWSDTPQNAVEFSDRVVHIWTNDNDYLVAVHVQAPSGTAGFDAAQSLLTEDFEVEVP